MALTLPFERGRLVAVVLSLAGRLRLAGTADQVAHYQLPRTPVKESDQRKAGWEARNGEGAVELDALEALYLGDLARIVRQAIQQYRDYGLSGRLADAESDACDSVGGMGRPRVEDKVEDLKDEGEVALPRASRTGTRRR